MEEHFETDLAKMHPTRAALVTDVVNRLDGSQPQEILSEAVLQSTGISRGSLYHHFENFDHLIETALVVRYARYMDQSIRLIEEILESNFTKDEFLSRLEFLIRITQDPERRSFRLERARILAAAEGNPRFERVLGREANRLTSAFTELIKDAMGRGYLRQDNDPQAVSVLIQAYTLGRIVDDFNHENPVDFEQSISLIYRIVREVIAEVDR